MEHGLDFCKTFWQHSSPQGEQDPGRSLCLLIAFPPYWARKLPSERPSGSAFGTRGCKRKLWLGVVVSMALPWISQFMDLIASS